MVMALFGGFLVGGFLGPLMEPVVRPWKQALESVVQTQILSPSEAVAGFRNGSLDTQRYYNIMRLNGYTQANALALYAASLLTPSPLQLIDAWRRGIINEAELINRWQETGYKLEDLDLFRRQTEFYPGPSDLISWQAKEVYEPATILKYGLEEELDALQREPFYAGGINDEQIRNYWIAHWEHPSWTQVQRFLHYGQVDKSFTAKDVFEWFKLVEIPPFWRREFIKTAFDPYTRVDIRRMWELGVIGDDEVVKGYQRLGYDEEHSRNLLTFTKLERSMPELRQRYKNGWIGATELEQELRSIGLPERRVRPVLERIIKQDKPARVQKERDLTKTEIIKAVRRERIAPQTGLQMLEQMGYSPGEAVVLLEINDITLASSPETPLEHWRLVELLKRHEGTPFPTIPDNLLEAERDYLSLDAQWREAVAKGSPEEETKELLFLRAKAESRYKGLALVNGWQP